MRRIVIIGVTGSGKTTLGRNISAKLGVPAIDLDELHWLPNWQTREDQFPQLVEEATKGSSWVISGYYRRVQPIFWPRADMLIWLDYSFPRIFWQLLRRSVLRIINQQAICNGNYETWRKFFSKDSIMVWFFQSCRRRRQAAKDIFSHPEQHPHLTLLQFRHPKETKKWLESIRHA